MVIDCHVHVSVMTGGRGVMSPKLVNSLPFRFMRWRLHIEGEGERQDQEVEAKLISTIAGAKALDAAAVLAFDGVYTDDGVLDEGRTHLMVSNGYVIDLARRHEQVLFGCSVHPYRKDVVRELERCIAAGAVLMKWLPISQGMDPSDARCVPVYECLAHHGVPLLAHTGGEHTLPRVDDSLADPMLLVPALKAGVKVIAAHCGTKSFPGERSYLDEWCRLAREYEHFYGDTSALNLPTRRYAYDVVLNDPVLRGKLVHGSDWPVIPIPGWRQIGTWGEPNWLARDVEIKRRLGLTEDEYWRRASKVLRMPIAGGSRVPPAPPA
jgi:predicted TIM-barrel fold metal-dependent hydrolase